MLKQLFESILSLIFPSLCLTCNTVLDREEPYLCTRCWATLPEVPQEPLLLETIAAKFWGKIPIEHANALYYFSHGWLVQRLIHKIKYCHREKAAYYLGKYYGQKLAYLGQLTKIHVIMPIPLHPTRMAERGFNQSEAFARGIATMTQLPLDTMTLIRQKETSSQTNKTRSERFANVEHAFATTQSSLTGRHILLIDDLITTGATIISACEPLLKAGATSISVGAIAVAL